MLDTIRIAELKAEVGEDDFAEVVALFCEEVEEVLAELHLVAPDKILGSIHFLKGSAQNIGLARVGEICLEEERRLRADPDLRPDVARIREAYAASKIQLLS